MSALDFVTKKKFVLVGNGRICAAFLFVLGALLPTKVEPLGSSIMAEFPVMSYVL